MSKDLAIFHLANRAEVEEIISLGARTSVRFLYSTDAQTAAGLVYSIQEDPVGEGVQQISPQTIRIEVEGAILTRFSGDGDPPLGRFKFLPGAGPAGEDQVKLAEAPISRFRMQYSTIEQDSFRAFSLRGRGFKFVTAVQVGGKEIPTFTVQTDSVMELEVPVDLASSVVVENVSALVELEESPTPTDIIFDISTRVKRATGAKLLQQRFLTLLLSPDGADLLNLVPKSGSMTPGLRTVVLNRVSLAVNITRSLLQRNTASDAPADEILASATVDGVTVEDATGAVNVQVKLRTLSGRDVSFPVGI